MTTHEYISKRTNLRLVALLELCPRDLSLRIHIVAPSVGHMGDQHVQGGLSQVGVGIHLQDKQHKPLTYGRNLANV